MSNIQKHIDAIFQSGIVNDVGDIYIHIRSDNRRPKENEFMIVNDELYISKSGIDGLGWAKYSA